MSSPIVQSRNPVVLEIGGQRLRLNANAEPGHLAQLARAVNERFETMQQATRSAVPSTVLALVALDLADEMHSLERRLEQVREEARVAVEAAEARVREVEQAARQAIREAIEEIDQALARDDAMAGTSPEASNGESETA